MRYVLEGSVRKAGNRVRITGQLIDAATGAHLWADRFDGALEDIFDLQDQVASSVVGAIEPRLAAGRDRARAAQADREPRRLRPLPARARADATNTPRRACARPSRCSDERWRSIRPYAPAAAMIGLVPRCSRESRLGRVSDAEIAEALRLARRAIEAGKDDPDVLGWRAARPRLFAGEHAAALTAVDRAFALNPNSAHAWTARGLGLVLQNRPAPAIEAFEQAIRLSPLDP